MYRVVNVSAPYPPLLGLLLLAASFQFVSIEAEAADPVVTTGEYFNDEGYRSEHYRTPTPESLPGGRVLVLDEVLKLFTNSDVILVDVLSAGDVEPDPFDGSWSIDKPHNYIPGSIWLPNVGRGYIDEQMSTYLESSLSEAVGGKLDTHVVVYCVDDCWMGWNAAKRLMAMGYTNVSWFRRGMTVWEQESHPVEVARPKPVPVD